MRTISKLEKEGYKGNDLCLEASLFEYGLIWKDNGDEISFIYRHPMVENRFDSYHGFKKSDMTFEKDFDWCDKKEIADYMGAEKIDDGIETVLAVIAYHGTECAFGASYDEGFSVATEGNLTWMDDLEKEVIYEAEDMEDPFLSCKCKTCENWESVPAHQGFSHLGTFELYLPSEEIKCTECESVEVEKEVYDNAEEIEVSISKIEDFAVFGGWSGKDTSAVERKILALPEVRNFPQGIQLFTEEGYAVKDNTTSGSFIAEQA